MKEYSFVCTMKELDKIIWIGIKGRWHIMNHAVNETSQNVLTGDKSESFRPVEDL